MPTYPLTSLLRLRRADEQRAEQALGEAMARRARAEAAHAHLVDEAARARAALDQRRATPSPPGTRADDLEAGERFQNRLATDAAGRAGAAAAHDRDVLTPAHAGEADARARYIAARNRREVVEKAIARRQAVQTRQHERRVQAEADDDTAARSPARDGRAIRPARR